MTPKLLRFAYVCEFLLALTAIFTVWPEIGGVAALELMHWGFKLGFGIALAGGIVAFTRTIVVSDRIVTLPSIAWLAAIVLLTVGMSVVTYYYTLEEESGESDEPSGTVSIYYSSMPSTGVYS
jgi:hypothetical protein